MSRAYTADEVREKMLTHIRNMVEYWAGLPDMSVEDRCDGVAFSVLTMLDGATELPACAVSVAAHPDDQAYHQGQGENWYPDGLVINADCDLHEAYAALVREKSPGRG